MIKFLQPPEDTPIVPTDGDIYHIATSRPFTTNDLFTFITSASRIDENQFNILKEIILDRMNFLQEIKEVILLKVLILL